MVSNSDPKVTQNVTFCRHWEPHSDMVFTDREPLWPVQGRFQKLAKKQAWKKTSTNHKIWKTVPPRGHFGTPFGPGFAPKSDIISASVPLGCPVTPKWCQLVPNCRKRTPKCPKMMPKVIKKHHISCQKRSQGPLQWCYIWCLLQTTSFQCRLPKSTQNIKN